MSEMVRARAPGKLFLLGEYAVLDGAPAVVAAVDRGVEVTLTREASLGCVEIASGEFGTRSFDAASVPRAEGPFRFVISAWQEAVREWPAVRTGGWRLRLDTQLMDPSGAKLGLGSSAATTVAVLAALMAAADGSIEGSEDRRQLLALALLAHQRAQGTGSGADVAASVFGGVILFEPGRPVARVEPLSLPSEAVLLAAWTGQQASTAALVDRYLGAHNGARKARMEFVAVSRQCVDRFVRGVAAGALPGSAIDDNGDALARMARALGVDAITPALHRAISVARAAGAAAKISGAGGGDCAIALTAGAAAADRVRSAWLRQELTPLDLRIAKQGVTVGRS